MYPSHNSQFLLYQQEYSDLNQQPIVNAQMSIVKFDNYVFSFCFVVTKMERRVINSIDLEDGKVCYFMNINKRNCKQLTLCAFMRKWKFVQFLKS